MTKKEIKNVEEEVKKIFQDEDIFKILKKGGEKELVEKAMWLGKKLVDIKLSTSQIRNVYSRVKERYNPTEVQLLRPLLAYAAGRNEEVKPLQIVLDKMLQSVNDEDTYTCFRNFFQAILAYHRYYGGKE